MKSTSKRTNRIPFDYKVLGEYLKFPKKETHTVSWPFLNEGSFGKFNPITKLLEIVETTSEFSSLTKELGEMVLEGNEQKIQIWKVVWDHQNSKRTQPASVASTSTSE
eukprot:GHVP01017023.1.p1 GENE.GHVP01017023.1~~GHVP01017023.1.p1  ORF type:complete len:108 (-),score=19.11 GHVP01017023.1:83-406(-)